ncbi:PAS domain-containing protein [Suttonella ornithocola]|uniref:PAS domain-containing protein n=1 Tax=Suttonella ornithocola TaxID=279832 RepID=UPI001C497D51|nr:PAS domain-containing protein [Suttonella ornithocola]
MPFLSNWHKKKKSKEEYSQKTTLLKHHNGSTRKVLVIEEEFPYPRGQLIISRVNLKGDIIHVNEAFITVSGYSKEELIGQSQSIIRHPDMPKTIFKQLWETITHGDKWFGYIKNLRKDGKYYWVYATIVPNYRDGKIIGYTAVRREAAPEKITEYDEIYRIMRQQENKA